MRHVPERKDAHLGPCPRGRGTALPRRTGGDNIRGSRGELCIDDAQFTSRHWRRADLCQMAVHRHDAPTDTSRSESALSCARGASGGTLVTCVRARRGCGGHHGHMLFFVLFVVRPSAAGGGVARNAKALYVAQVEGRYACWASFVGGRPPASRHATTRDIGGPCRRHLRILAKIRVFRTCRRHVGDMSATFPTKRPKNRQTIPRSSLTLRIGTNNNGLLPLCFLAPQFQTT